MTALPPSILQQQLARLPPDVNRILYVKSLPFKITTEDLYDIFGKFGAVRQIRLGNTPASRGKAYVVYEDVFDAQRALEHLNGFNIMGRYLVVLYHHKDAPKTGAAGAGAAGGKTTVKEELSKKKAELDKLKQAFGVKGMDE